ncbi:hypothetical protein FQA39_LY19234 [Lamprigera yunnana]|nr:hypothetical protein FQA39_LY19234 [Lamprigera yunnana]
MRMAPSYLAVMARNACHAKAPPEQGSAGFLGGGVAYWLWLSRRWACAFDVAAASIRPALLAPANVRLPCRRWPRTLAPRSAWSPAVASIHSIADVSSSRAAGCVRSASPLPGRSSDSEVRSKSIVRVVLSDMGSCAVLWLSKSLHCNPARRARSPGLRHAWVAAPMECSTLAPTGGQSRPWWPLVLRAARQTGRGWGSNMAWCWVPTTGGGATKLGPALGESVNWLLMAKSKPDTGPKSLLPSAIWVIVGGRVFSKGMGCARAAAAAAATAAGDSDAALGTVAVVFWYSALAGSSSWPRAAMRSQSGPAPLVNWRASLAMLSSASRSLRLDRLGQFGMQRAARGARYTSASATGSTSPASNWLGVYASDEAPVVMALTEVSICWPPLAPKNESCARLLSWGSVAPTTFLAFLAAAIPQATADQGQDAQCGQQVSAGCLAGRRQAGLCIPGRGLSTALSWRGEGRRWDLERLCRSRKSAATGVVSGLLGVAPVVEGDVKAIKIRLAARRNIGHELLGRFARFFGRNHDGRAVRVVGPDKVDRIALHSLRTHPGVGLDVFHDVADVEVAIGVWQGGGDEDLSLRHRDADFSDHWNKLPDEAGQI